MNITSSQKQLVLVPKKSVISGNTSRNDLVSIITRAGYDNILNGFNRCDEIEQGDLVFRGIKGADAIASELEINRGRVILIIAGSDIVAEADLQVQRYDIQSRIQPLLSLGIGECSLDFLSPEISPVNTKDDVNNRTIFTKYSSILRSLLRAEDIDANVRRTEGADTRVRDWCRAERNASEVAAFEIVGTGKTAKDNGLQVLGIKNLLSTDRISDAPYLSLSRITTDLYVTNIINANEWTRGAIREIGLAFESVRKSNQYIPINFNIPADRVESFLGFGMKGPTMSNVLSNDGKDWRALEIFVPTIEANRVRVELLRYGAEDIGFGQEMQMEMSSEDSEILNALPFSSDSVDVDSEITSSDKEEMRATEAVKGLSALRDKILDRVQNPKPDSSTLSALNLGLEFCINRYQVELIELCDALISGTLDDKLDEAAQCLYWFLVILQSSGISLEDALLKLFDEAVFKKYLSYGAGGIESAIMNTLFESSNMSTALRKKSHELAVVSVGDSLCRLSALLRIADIDLYDVICRERNSN